MQDSGLTVPPRLISPQSSVLSLVSAVPLPPSRIICPFSVEAVRLLFLKERMPGAQGAALGTAQAPVWHLLTKQISGSGPLLEESQDGNLPSGNVERMWGLVRLPVSRFSPRTASGLCGSHPTGATSVPHTGGLRAGPEPPDSVICPCTEAHCPTTGHSRVPVPSLCSKQPSLYLLECVR